MRGQVLPLPRPSQLTLYMVVVVVVVGGHRPLWSDMGARTVSYPRDIMLLGTYLVIETLATHVIGS